MGVLMTAPHGACLSQQTDDASKERGARARPSQPLLERRGPTPGSDAAANPASPADQLCGPGWSRNVSEPQFPHLRSRGYII